MFLEDEIKIKLFYMMFWDILVLKQDCILTSVLSDVPPYLCAWEFTAFENPVTIIFNIRSCYAMPAVSTKEL